MLISLITKQSRSTYLLPTTGLAGGRSFASAQDDREEEVQSMRDGGSKMEVWDGVKNFVEKNVKYWKKMENYL